MTPEQRELARHALGLPNKSQRSFRNHFVCGPGHSDYADWMAMTKAGLAKRRDGGRMPFSGNDLFWLTRSGAEAALDPREKLDPDDFPEPPHAD